MKRLCPEHGRERSKIDINALATDAIAALRMDLSDGTQIETLLETHRGSLTFTTKQGTGSTFVFRWPTDGAASA
jgi:hypothetical protein